MNKLDDAAMLEVLRSELDVQRVPPEVSRILLPRFFGNPVKHTEKTRKEVTEQIRSRQKKEKKRPQAEKRSRTEDSDQYFFESTLFSLFVQFICSAIVRSLLESMVLEVREGEVVVHVASLDKTLQSFPAEIEKVVLSKIDR